MKPLRLILKLKEGHPPHLFISQIKEIILKDKSLHKDMKNLLLFLKKTKQTHIPLSETQELVIDFDNYRSFQRGVKPKISAWIRKEMDTEEIEDYNLDKKGYLKGVLNLYDSMGYEFYNQQEIDQDFLNKLVQITEPKKKK